MNEPIIYLCGPIAGCNDEECFGWRKHVATKSWIDMPACNGAGMHYLNQTVPYQMFKILDPTRRDYRKFETLTLEQIVELVELDKLDINRADCLLVYLTPGKSSIGTHQEIIYGWELDKLVVVVTQEEKLSPWIIYHSHKICKDLDEAVKFITKHYQINHL